MFDGWLREFVEARGWPFSSLFDATTGSHFGGILLDLPPTEADFSWRKIPDKAALVNISLTVKESFTILLLLAHHPGRSKQENAQCN